MHKAVYAATNRRCIVAKRMGNRYRFVSEDNQSGPRNRYGDQTGVASWRKESFYSRLTRARGRAREGLGHPGGAIRLPR